MAVANMIGMERVIHTLQVLALCLPQLATERVIVVDMLDNGSFEETSALGLPWWRTSRGAGQLGDDASLVTLAGDFAEQPIAAYAPLAAQLVIEGEVRGDG